MNVGLSKVSKVIGFGMRLGLSPSHIGGIVFLLCLAMHRHFFAGSLLFTHWMGLIGGFWIAVVTPVYVVLKHRRPMRIKAWVRMHMFGNLVAFMLISVHFVYWIISVSFIGTGMALFVATLTLVVTGLLYRFNMVQNSRRYIRFIHVSMTTAFFLILTIHILSHMIRQ